MATPNRAIRVPARLWEAALHRADEVGTTVTTVVVDALEAFVLAPHDEAIAAHEAEHPDCAGPDGCPTAMVLWTNRADAH